MVLLHDLSFLGWVGAQRPGVHDRFPVFGSKFGVAEARWLLLPIIKSIRWCWLGLILLVEFPSGLQRLLILLGGWDFCSEEGSSPFSGTSSGAASQRAPPVSRFPSAEVPHVPRIGHKWATAPRSSGFPARLRPLRPSSAALRPPSRVRDTALRPVPLRLCGALLFYLNPRRLHLRTLRWLLLWRSCHIDSWLFR